VIKLKLDVNKPEYSGRINNDEIWQTVAFNKTVENIALLISQSKALLASDEANEPKGINRIHDAIFISGSRGTGKSIFLCNLEQQWNKAKVDKNIEGNAKFLKVIDPTLLIGSESFVNVVIAHIHQFVHAKIKDTSEYHQILGKLAESLAQTEYKSREDLSGLDRIISYQSSMDLEFNFHEYLDFCCEQLKCDVFVLPIDDVDMALEQSYDVLETIRRLLSCPRLIPIVSGDKGLYEHVLLNEFNYCKTRDRKLFPSGSDYPKHLMKQYWRKIFPANLTIPLANIDTLFDDMAIVNSNKKDLGLDKFFTLINEQTSALVNGKEKSIILERPDTARKLVQYVKSFHLFSENGAINGSTKIWQELSRYSLSTGNGQGYLVAEAEMRLLKRSKEHCALRLADLPLFDIVQQNSILTANTTLKTHPYYEGNLVPSGIDSSDVMKSQLSILTDLQDTIKSSVVTLPKIEFYTPGARFSANERKSYLDNTNDKKRNNFLIELFSHHDYYADMSYTTYQIYFGKAFEILSLTLLQSINHNTCLELIIDVCADKPFHSLLELAPTKTFNIENIDNDETDESYDDDLLSYNSILAKQIYKWQRDNENTLQKAKEKGLAHLISRVFNKVFTQFFNMRQKNVFGFNNRNNNKDNLFHLMQRFRIVLLTAIGSFLKQGKVALQNTATTPNRDTLLTLDRYSDRAYQLNVHGLISDNNDENANLMQAIFMHPIFQSIDQAVIEYFESGVQQKVDDVIINLADFEEDAPNLYNIFNILLSHGDLQHVFEQHTARDIMKMAPGNLKIKYLVQLKLILEEIIKTICPDDSTILNARSKSKLGAYKRHLTALESI
jgi:hypothetical protein